MITNSDTRIKIMDAATSASAAPDFIERSQYAQHSFHVINANAATVKLWVSANGSDWLQLGSDITTSQFIVAPQAVFPYIKATRDNSTGGTVTVWLCSGVMANR